ncbi:enoyl-CoA hydratase/isomerase family protein [Sphingobacterium alkalisoli]|uniref:Enoyl-CoA hydratase/isomerase family protein n=1 Tax=Sphingobacterium alkalisoli TaxID=1874115 RepID=A0A4U0H7M6_9SPHI|nr:enoyl-CoA hydratase/isomerase family protein [Sphingobacterium alkalisoli]TJY67873.1 enoyl-CoA hydratase/isomerase family protein [Sphingobacterium alkalisoli]GGH10781.1 hypothetical protein GCM10011418_09280 [Sphingobacterium alkalisoli]
MNFLKVIKDDHIFHITLDRGKSNAIDIHMVNELIAAIQEAEVDPAIEGLILSGKEGFFSSGLDLITLYDYNAEEMKEFWSRFMLLLHSLASFSKPAVSAITGHSPAGGCVLAICCDYRIMAEGEYIIGLNEVPVGIVVPDSIFELYSFWLGKAQAYRFLLEGKLLKPQEALKVGLVDEVVDFNRIQNASMRKVKSVTQFEKNAWRLTKLNLRKSLLSTLSENHDTVIDQVLKQWWSPATRTVMKTIIANLTHKKA